MAPVLDVAASPTAASPKLYWSVHGFTDADSRIDRADLDGTGVETIVGSGLRAPWDLEMDAAGGKLYWGDVSAHNLQRCNLDGTGVEMLLDGPPSTIDDPGGVAFDPLANDLYWTDLALDRVNRLDLDTGINHILLSVPSTTFVGIALDPGAGLMYWADASTDTIRKANLDGTNMDVVLAGLSNPRDIELDLASGHMYVANLGGGIYRANLDGGDLTLLASGQFGGGANCLTLDLARRAVYWTESANGHVSRINLDGTGYQPDLIEPVGGIGRGVAVIPEPATLALLVTFTVGAISRRRRRSCSQ
ncbi:MAG TPA: PEP-CTERM sorting domain-containing protein [Phycisphaerae bacterium]|nr:PEP-CTERM sorting domain-containing protein [Phycisphaerae bacterium]